MIASSNKLLRTFKTSYKVDPGERAVIASVSTAIVDHDKDVLLPSGVLTEVFNDNPIMQLYHNGDELPLGNWPYGIQTTNKAVKSKGVFIERSPYHPPQAEWLPDTILWYFQKQVLKAFSVGFTIEDAREANQKDKERFGEDVGRVITKWQLLEISVVNIPANRLALAQAVSKGIVKKSLLTEMWEIDEKTHVELDIQEKAGFDIYTSVDIAA